MPDHPQSARHNVTERKVGIGELAVIKQEGLLRTLLGSCLGLVLHDRRACVGGLAHIVLPLSGEDRSLPGKFADTAIPELVRMIEQSGGKPQALVAKLAGGANMFASVKSNGIGDQNQAMVEKILKELGIRIAGRHCGGRQGRRLAYDVQTGIVTVEILGSPSVIL